MNIPATITIPDIARHAGVGTATVDRVLNGRPGVNAETTEKVLQAVKTLGAPLVTRGRPRKQRNLRFAYVLPDNHESFVELVERQIAQAASEFRHQHMTEITHCLSASEPEVFAQALAQLDGYDGMAVLAPDHPTVKLAINDKVRAGVHVVTLLSDVAGSMREVYVGADNRAAGRTAALLLARMSGPAPRDTLLLLSSATRMSSEIDRRIGFAQLIEDDFKSLQVVRSPDCASDNDACCEALKKFLQSELDPARLAGVYSCAAAGTEGVVQALQALNLEPAPGLVVHDMTDVHQSLLGRGDLTYVLTQDNHYCITAAARVLRGLCDNVRGAVQVVRPRVEILTSENYH